MRNDNEFEEYVGYTGYGTSSNMKDGLSRIKTEDLPSSDEKENSLKIKELEAQIAKLTHTVDFLIRSVDMFQSHVLRENDILDCLENILTDEDLRKTFEKVLHRY